MDTVLQHLQSQQQSSLDELFEFLRIPSVSADSAFLPEMQRCAQFVLQSMTDAGLTAEIIPTKGHAIVYGERIEDSSLPTILVYGHYDVNRRIPLISGRLPRSNLRFATAGSMLVVPPTTKARSSPI